MKEIIAFLIVSGGLGFFNLYIAQESDLLYFGKYNKEERLAWLSIYTIINFLLIKAGIWTLETLITIHLGIVIAISSLVLILALDLAGTLLLPIFINWLIEIIRMFLKKEPRSYLPPTNSFFEDIDQWQLFTFDFDGKMINAGSILQATEERQEDFLLMMRPTLPEERENYYDFLDSSLEMAKRGMIIIRELTDYTNGIHFIKIKEI